MKALIIGFGAAGKTHLQAYRDTGVEVIAIADPQAMETAGGVEMCGNDWKRLLPDVDVVSICSPDEFHFLQAVECLKAGKHVMVEKPPCTRPDELKFLIEWTSKHPEQYFACSLPLPWHFAGLAEKIPSLGKIYLIEAEYNYGRKHKLLSGWRAKPDYSMLLGGGLHMLDLMFWLTPERPVDGAAMSVTTTKARHDTIQAIMRFPSGAIGRLGVNGGYNGRHYHRICVYGETDFLIEESVNEVDKAIAITAFVEAIRSHAVMDHQRLWSAMQVCFEIEGQI